MAYLFALLILIYVLKNFDWKKRKEISFNPRFAPPLHFNCRCVNDSMLEEKLEGVDDEMER